MKETRQQNYMFAYNIVPAFLFRSDFAKTIAEVHPHGFLYFQKYWEQLSRIFPPEHVVSAETLKAEAYQLAEGVFCLIVHMPPSDRQLEVQFLAIVLQPKLRYFVAGQGFAPDVHTRLTIREVTVNGHGRCGTTPPSAESFTEELAEIIGLSPNIRLAEELAMRDSSESIETFPAEFQMTPPEHVLILAATYRVMSQIWGDTSGIPAHSVEQFHALGGEHLQHAVFAILNQDETAAKAAIQSLKQKFVKPPVSKSLWRIEMSPMNGFKMSLAGFASIFLGASVIAMWIQDRRVFPAGIIGGPIAILAGIVIIFVSAIALYRASKLD